jgi:predicted kinase
MCLTTITLEVSSPEQEALLRQFHVMIMEMEQLALSAPAGQVLEQCEAAVLERGRRVNSQVLQRAVQQRIDALEKKGRRCGIARVADGGKTAVWDDGKS